MHRFLKQMVNQTRGYSTDPEIDDALLVASRELFAHYNGPVSEYAPGRPIPREGYQLNTTINVALHPFKKSQDYAVSPTAPAVKLANGFIPFPKGYVRPTAFDVPGAEETARIVNDNQLAFRLKSPVNAPTAEYPIIAVVDKGYQLYPKDVAAVTFGYLALPPEPRYALKLDSQGEIIRDAEGEPTYDDANSVDHGWPEANENELIARALKILGVEGRDAAVQQFGQYQAEKGE
ncbi:hypothetical protein [Hymenobacter metallicola]|uniref:Uncharacterized protein n=1 Tax=Hymenobacter metallicola TaxID=2563114 RepID=A0A4Z0QKN8_9BACT|nr:hypothetical protein [Hymenobacter metallicola]TGE29813.1 hypothetical protein E5K02_10240 [Hymenobacter metallicola]